MSEKIKKMPKGIGKRIIATLKNKEMASEYPEYDDSFEKNENEINEIEEEYTETESFEEESTYIEEYQEEKVEIKPAQTKSIETKTGSSDIDTLLNLISRLPSGVTKQTGALIIRQTMEAMGIPMNDVLSNAQSVQEDLEHNIKNNVNVIEEYRTKIKILEQEIQKFRKKAHELEDIISLFILSDDKKTI